VPIPMDGSPSIPKPLVAPGKKLLYTHSSSKSYRTCNYQYLVQYVWGYRTVKQAKALVFGTLIHKCLEAYWLARKAKQAEPIHAAMAVLVQASVDMDPYERMRVKVMLITYAVVWSFIECEVLGVELQFRHSLLNPQDLKASEIFERSGKIDLILRIGTDVVVVEHKTSSEDVGPGSDYRTRLTLDEQVSFYYAGAKALGFKPDYVIYDILKKFTEKPRLATPVDKREYVTDKKTKQTRLRANQRLTDETPQEYGKRLADAATPDPEQYIHRVKIVRMQKERIKFALNVWQQSRLMETSLAQGLWPKNSDACFKNRCSLIPHCYQGARLEDDKLFTKLDMLHPELEPEEEEEVDAASTTAVST
jgi:hypothetical protein